MFLLNKFVKYLKGTLLGRFLIYVYKDITAAEIFIYLFLFFLCCSFSYDMFFKHYLMELIVGEDFSKRIFFNENIRILFDKSSGEVAQVFFISLEDLAENSYKIEVVDNDNDNDSGWYVLKPEDYPTELVKKLQELQEHKEERSDWNLISLGDSVWTKIKNFWMPASLKGLPPEEISIYDIIYGYWAYFRNFLIAEDSMKAISEKEFCDSTKSRLVAHMFYYKESDFDLFVSKRYPDKNNPARVFLDSIEEFVALGYDLKNDVKRILLCTNLSDNFAFEDGYNRVKINRVLIETYDGKLIKVELNDFEGFNSHKGYIYFDDDKVWDFLNIHLRNRKPSYHFFRYQHNFTSFLELNFTFFSPEDFPNFAHIFVRSTKNLNDLFLNFKSGFDYEVETFETFDDFEEKKNFVGDPKLQKNILVYNKETNTFSAFFVDSENKKIYYINSLRSAHNEEPDYLELVREYDFPFNNKYIVAALNPDHNIFKDYLFVRNFKVIVEDLDKSKIIFFFHEKDWKELLHRIEVKTSSDLYKNKNIIYFKDDQSLKDFFSAYNEAGPTDAKFGHICYIFINEHEYYVCYIFYLEDKNVLCVAYTKNEVLDTKEINWVRRRYLNDLKFNSKGFENIYVKPLEEPNDFSFPLTLKSMLAQFKGRYSRVYCFNAEAWEVFKANTINSFKDEKSVVFCNSYDDITDYLDKNNFDYDSILLEKATSIYVYDPTKGLLYNYDVVVTAKHVFFIGSVAREEDRAFYSWMLQSYPSESKENFSFPSDEEIQAKFFFNTHIIRIDDSKGINVFAPILDRRDKFELRDLEDSRYNTLNFFNKEDFFKYTKELSNGLSSEIASKKIVILNDLHELFFILKREGINFNKNEEKSFRFSLANIVDKDNGNKLFSFNIIETEEIIFMMPQKRGFNYFFDLNKMTESVPPSYSIMSSLLKNGTLSGEFYCYKNCAFAKDSFNNFYKNNFCFNQNYRLFEKDLFFKNEEDLRRQLQLLWLYKQENFGSYHHNSIFFNTIAIALKPEFNEPAKILNFSSESSNKELDCLAESYDIEHFSSVNELLKSDFGLSEKSEDYLLTDDYSLFNEMVTLNYNEIEDEFKNKSKKLFIFDKSKTKLAVTEVEPSKFDRSIAKTISAYLKNEDSLKKSLYLKNEFFIYLKKNFAKETDFAAINGVQTRLPLEADKKIFMEELRTFIKNKNNNDI